MDTSSERTCPINNACDTLDGQVLLCVNPDPNLSPLPLAEELCDGALRIQYQRAQADVEGPDDAVGMLRQAWAQAELGMSFDIGNSEAADHFDDVEILLERIGELDLPPFQVAFRAGLLAAYLPLIMQRRKNTDPRTLQQRLAIGRSVADLMDRPEGSNDTRVYGTKGGPHHIFNRSELEFFPSSDRERDNPNPRMVESNHDGYIILDDQKIPVLFASGTLRHDPGVLHLPYRRIVTRELQTVGASGREVDDFAQLLMAEARSKSIDDHAQTWADRVTETMVQSVINFANRS